MSVRETAHGCESRSAIHPRINLLHLRLYNLPRNLVYSNREDVNAFELFLDRSQLNDNVKCLRPPN